MAPREPIPSSSDADIKNPKAEQIRLASKSERRYITRHALDFYRCLIVGGLYTFTSTSTSPLEPPTGKVRDSACDLRDAKTYIPALKHCINTHPSLATAVQDAETEKPIFVRRDRVDLRNHLEIVAPETQSSDLRGDDGEDREGQIEKEKEMLKRTMQKAHDCVLKDVDSVPGWRVVVLPLPVSEPSIAHSRDEPVGTVRRVYILFAYSHTHSDGRSGLNFHKTFLEGLRLNEQACDDGYIYDTTASSSKTLPPAVEDVAALRITWLYLLLTLLGGHVPEFLRRWAGFSMPVATEGTWIGEVMQYPEAPEQFRTGVEMLVAKKETMEAVLGVCRVKKGVKFTGLLNALVVRALSGALAGDSGADSIVEDFIGQIVIDLRGLVGAYPADMMVNCVSAVYERSCRVANAKGTDLKNETALWSAARETTQRLAVSAGTLVNQPIGLVAYLNEFRPWFLGKLGQKRDSSYEISNAVVFEPPSASEREEWDIERMVFSQPANVTSCPLSFSVVTRKDGDMVLTLNWQVGVLGVDDEDAFAKDVLARIDGYLVEIAEV
ncbi:hypothetical protein BJY04DRAFT_224429 [Aspergillus karnatakaensis]|uniref:uncharacterized protein n=1 Tax=Aspergillus karnatakaensis TaxID=1810916 RepID=UPI003CCE01B8